MAKDYDWFCLTLGEGQREKITKMAEQKRTSRGAIARMCIDIGIARMERAEEIL